MIINEADRAAVKAVETCGMVSEYVEDEYAEDAPEMKNCFIYFEILDV